MGKPRAEWATDIAIIRLRQWWSEGKTTAEIGRRLNASKNAIVGKAHRLDLPERPSPIRVQQPVLPPPPPLVFESEASAALPPAPSLPSLPSLPSPAASPAPAPSPPAVVHPVFVAPVRIDPPPIARRMLVEPCCWVTQEGGRGRPWVYCDAPGVPNRPYCDKHNRLVRAKVQATDVHKKKAGGG